MPERSYSIREVAQLTGLPASTLRYYESIGLTPPVARGESSGHRVYSEADLDLALWVSCLAATGMPIEMLREYVANGRPGSEQSSAQVELLARHADTLARQAEQLEVRRRYVALKIEFWRAMDAGDPARAQSLGDQAAGLARSIQHTPA